MRGIALTLVWAVVAFGQAGAPAAPLTVAVNSKDGQSYVLIPAGRFVMGCAEEADGLCRDNENPAHGVRLTKGFWIGQMEVTTGAYMRFVKATGRRMPPGPVSGRRKLNRGWKLETLPMTMVDWNDAKAYCEWAGMRLPTEAEWEYAARGGTQGARYGDLDEIAWHGKNSGGTPHPVGGKRANDYKLYDMLGNVWEWTADWYAGQYSGSGEATDPTGPATGTYRVLRGGSWDLVDVVRAASRNGYGPANRLNGLGFRCAGEDLIP